MKTKSEEMSDLTDTLTDLLAKGEQAIIDLKLGVTASVPLDNGATMTFRKMGKVWGIIITDHVGSTYRLTKAKRSLRVAASTKLEDLIAALTKEAERQLAAVKSGITKLHELLVAFEQSKSL